MPLPRGESRKLWHSGLDVPSSVGEIKIDGRENGTQKTRKDRNSVDCLVV